MPMPKLICDNSNEILVDVARGKRHLNNPSRLDSQSPQKGKTCFYYVFNSVRFHYGDGNINEKERKIEKIFSNFRRGMNDIEKLIILSHDCSKDIIDGIDVEVDDSQPINRKMVKLYLDNLEKQAQSLNIKFDINAEDIRFLLSFINQEKYNILEEFAVDIENKRQIELCEKTIKELGEAVSENFSSFYQEHIKNLKASIEDKYGDYLKQIDDFSEDLENKSSAYLKIISNMLAKYYGLIESSWTPSDKIEQFMDMIRLYGPHVVHTVPALVVNKSQSICEKKFDDWNIYTPIDSNIDTESDFNIGHAILVVGVKKEGNENFIYYMDPNDGNSIQGERTIYKVPYELFCAKLTNIYGVNFKETEVDKVNGPFAYHMPLQKYDELYNFVTTGIALINEESKSSRKRELEGGDEDKHSTKPKKN